MMPPVFDLELAFKAGVIGGSVTFLLLFLARYLHLCGLNYPAILGSIITREEDSGSQMLGFMLHLAISGLFGLLYAALFYPLHGSGWLRGWIISVPHVMLSMLLIVVAALMVSPVRKNLRTLIPREYHVSYTVAILVMLHMVYGMTVGIVYTM